MKDASMLTLFSSVFESFNQAFVRMSGPLDPPGTKVGDFFVVIPHAGSSLESPSPVLGGSNWTGLTRESYEHHCPGLSSLEDSQKRVKSLKIVDVF